MLRASSPSPAGSAECQRTTLALPRATQRRRRARGARQLKRQAPDACVHAGSCDAPRSVTPVPCKTRGCLTSDSRGYHRTAAVACPLHGSEWAGGGDPTRQGAVQQPPAPVGGIPVAWAGWGRREQAPIYPTIFLVRDSEEACWESRARRGADGATHNRAHPGTRQWQGGTRRACESPLLVPQAGRPRWRAHAHPHTRPCTPPGHHRRILWASAARAQCTDVRSASSAATFLPFQ